jgi:adenosine deaminase
VGIGGTEHRFPPELFESAFAQARRFGFKTSAHAGETSGPESVWGAICFLDVDRIGHATRAIEDDALVEYLAERRIPVEICPVSNVRTGVVPSIEAHPIGQYLQHGILVTVNTDDPALFGNSLAGEFDLLAGTFGLTNADLRALVLNAARSAWISEEAKAMLIRAITDEWSA